MPVTRRRFSFYASILFCFIQNDIIITHASFVVDSFHLGSTNSIRERQSDRGGSNYQGGLPLTPKTKQTSQLLIQPFSAQQQLCYYNSQIRNIHQHPKCAEAMTKTTTTQLYNSNSYWDGDDVRWSSKAMRRWQRKINVTTRAGCSALIALNTAAFLYQVITTVHNIRMRHPSYWPNQAVPIILDSIWGSARPGPFTLDFVHNQRWSLLQPHRFISSGFLHGGILHLIANCNALINLPAWLETGLGRSLYISTFIVSIIGGNVMDTITNIDATSLCLGASGGICGLYGLMYVCLVRMENKTAAFRVLKGMGVLFLYGIVFANISNAGHIGGFITGIIMGVFFGPSYPRSYGLRRKNSLEVDLLSREYRQVIGYDKKPTKRGYIPVSVLWIASIGAILLSNQAKYRMIPKMIFEGMVHPGSVFKLL